MKSVIVIDDKWESEKRNFLKSPDFNGVSVIGFSDVYEARDQLDKMKPEDYPDTCIIDVVSVPPVSESDRGVATFSGVHRS